MANRFARPLLLLLLFQSSTAIGWPCSCVTVKTRRKPSLQEVFRGEYVYFEGEVESVELRSNHALRRLVKVRVFKNYNGPQAENITLETGLGFGDCGFPFVVGRKYFVCARKNESGHFETGICGPTSLLEYAGELRRFLRNDTTARKGGARLCGRVADANGAPARYAVVSVWRDLGNGSREHVEQQVVSEKSRYRIEDIAPGKYLLAAVSNPTGRSLQLGFYPDGKHIAEAQPLELRPRARTCNVNFSLHSQQLYRIRGRLQSVSTGSQPKGIVLVILASAPDAPFPVVEQRMTNADGGFAFLAPAGRFSITAQVGTSEGAAVWPSETLDLEVSGDRDDLVLKVEQQQ